MRNVKKFIILLALLSFCNFPVLSTLTENDAMLIGRTLKKRLAKEEEERIGSCVERDIGNQRKYNSLSQSSARYGRYFTFNYLSLITKGSAGLISAGGGIISFLSDEDKDIISGAFFLTAGLIIIDLVWHYSAKRYAEAPEKLEQFLKSEASKYYSDNPSDIEKAQVIAIVRNTYESRRRSKKDQLLEEVTKINPSTASSGVF